MHHVEAHNKTLKKFKLNRKKGNKKEITRDFVLLKKTLIILVYHNTNKKKLTRYRKDNLFNSCNRLLISK